MPPIQTTRRTLLLSGLAAAAAPALAHAQSADFAAAARYSAERRGVSLLVIRNGRVLFDDYPNDGGPDRGWELASGTKSFTGLMAAAAVQDGLLAIDEPVAETIHEWRADTQRSRITIRHLLNLTAGIDLGPGQRSPTYAEALQLPLAHEPGTHFQYGPAPFQIFGELLRRKVTPRFRDPQAYLQHRLFDALNIAPARWRRGRDGMPHMPQGAHFTAPAWAAFGQCVIEGGRGLVDAETLAQCFGGSQANPGYGLSWWLLRPGLRPPTRSSGVTIPDNALRQDVRMAAGAGDQRLYLIPRRGLVIARQASPIFAGPLRRGPRWNDAEFLRFIVAL